LIKYIKSVLWRVAKRLSYIEEARCLKVNYQVMHAHGCLTPNDSDLRSLYALHFVVF